jgi:hypothetical protein
VSVQQQSGNRRASYWPIPLARAIVLIATALVITFSQDHSATLGLTVFGAFAIVTGVIFALAAILVHRGAERVIVLLQALVSVIAGVLALVINGGGLPFFLYLVSVFSSCSSAFVPAERRPAETGSSSARSPCCSQSSCSFFRPISMTSSPAQTVPAGFSPPQSSRWALSARMPPSPVSISPSAPCR